MPINMYTCDVNICLILQQILLTTKQVSRPLKNEHGVVDALVSVLLLRDHVRCWYDEQMTIMGIHKHTYLFLDCMCHILRKMETGAQ